MCDIININLYEDVGPLNNDEMLLRLAESIQPNPSSIIINSGETEVVRAIRMAIALMNR